MDDELKAAAEDMFHSMGMNMSMAINIFVTQAVRKQRFPFPIEADPFYSVSNMSVLRRRARDMDAGEKVSVHDVIEVEEPVHA
jgi:DNA-damage-inducible protein J